MTVNQITTAIRISDIIREGLLNPRKPGVSSKFIRNILRGSELKNSQGSTTKAH